MAIDTLPDTIPTPELAESPAETASEYLEREVLETTLTGTVRVLTDVFSAVSPEAYGRSLRITRTVDHLVQTLQLAQSWRFHLAAVLSQLGCVTLDEELVQKAYSAAPLTPAEQTRFDSHPQRAMHILAPVPRLEPVAWIIGEQLKTDALLTVPTLPYASPADAPALLQGARILRLAVAYAALRVKLSSEDYVMVRLHNRADEFGPDLVHALAGMGPGEAILELRRVPMTKLAAGMVLDQEIRNRQGLLVVNKGQTVTQALLFKLENFARNGLADREVMAFISV